MPGTQALTLIGADNPGPLSQSDCRLHLHILVDSVT